MATRTHAKDTSDEKPPMADWPEAPVQPTVPVADQQPGPRLLIFPLVAIFGLNARENAIVFDTDEVRACEATGLLEVVEELDA